MNDDLALKTDENQAMSSKLHISKLSTLSTQKSDVSIFSDSDPVLSVKRNGVFTFQLNSGINGGNLSIDSQGINPERRFSYSGNEEASSLPGDGKFGRRSVFNTCDSVQSTAISNQPLEHPSKIDYIFSSPTPTFAVQITGALICGGSRVISAVQDADTRVDGGFEVTTSQTFVYKGAGEEQVYIVYRIPSKWDDGSVTPDDPREFGTVSMYVTV